MIKIVTVIGARPQFIKAAAVSRIINLHPSTLQEAIVHTGQHFDENMSHVFFDELQINKPKYNLGISGSSHGQMTGDMLKGIEEVLLVEKPDLVLVYGDTNSTLAAALAASKMHISIAHVEAGLRSFSMNMPEEINRILTDRVSRFLFCPTQTAVENLKNEGFPFKNQTLDCVGDVMEDLALYYKVIAKEKSNILEGHNLEGGAYNLATIHRAENTDDPVKLTQIVKGLNLVNQDLKVIVPLHPRTKQKLKDLKLKVDFTVIEPVGYLNMITLINQCNLVLTDSGGLQKEAFFFDKFCVTMREETEWVELVNGGYNNLVGSRSELILKAYNGFNGRKFVKEENYYGGGKASEKIVDQILNTF